LGRARARRKHRARLQLKILLARRPRVTESNASISRPSIDVLRALAVPARERRKGGQIAGCIVLREAMPWLTDTDVGLAHGFARALRQARTVTEQMSSPESCAEAGRGIS
jgi:hypothetical protein